MLNNLLTEYRRFGYYEVGEKLFFNKTDAFIDASATGNDLRWNFNDDIFSAIDWTIPISTPLSELYRQRAQQLRDKYDFVSLFFSGGVDSGNVLHAFIDNNILLDEIIIYRPKSLESTFNNTDRSNSNLFSETKFAALPHLRKHIKDSRTKIRILDMDISADNFLNNSKIVAQFQTTNIFQPSALSRLAMCLDDPIWNKYYAAGKTSCHIHGVDKPMIKLTNGQYSFQFLDIPVMCAMRPVPTYHTELTEMVSKYQSHELFYWTPDLPQLVVKQCQVVKAGNAAGTFNRFFESADRLRQDKFTFMFPWIYPPDVISLRDAFCTEKNGLDLYAGQQKWFYSKLPEYARGEFGYMVKNIQSTIHNRFFRDSRNTNCYLGDPETDGPKTSFRSIKSKEYML